MHNSSPPINLHPNISPSSLYGEDDVHRLFTLFPRFMQQLLTANNFYTHNISPSSLYGEEVVCTTFTPIPILLHNSSPPNQYLHHNISPSSDPGEEGLHDIHPYSRFMHKTHTPPIHLHPQHLAIIFILGSTDGCCTTIHPTFPIHAPTHSPPSNLPPQTSRHHLYMGKTLCTTFTPMSRFMHNSSPPSTYTHNISPSSLYGEGRLCTTFTPISDSCHILITAQSTDTPHTSRSSSLLWGR
ncbi:hypothetical protein EWB00_005223, partial [Schistosoma japonicum]